MAIPGLAAMVKQTEVFIESDPVDLVITPAVNRRSDGAGGWITDAGPSYIERVRLIPQSDKVPEVATTDGVRSKIEFVLLALPPARARIGRYDTFVHQGRTWKILQIHPGPEYEFKADVIEYGG